MHPISLLVENNQTLRWENIDLSSTSQAVCAQTFEDEAYFKSFQPVRYMDFRISAMPKYLLTATFGAWLILKNNQNLPYEHPYLSNMSRARSVALCPICLGLLSFNRRQSKFRYSSKPRRTAVLKRSDSTGVDCTQSGFRFSIISIESAQAWKCTTRLAAKWPWTPVHKSNTKPKKIL